MTRFFRTTLHANNIDANNLITAKIFNLTREEPRSRIPFTANLLFQSLSPARNDVKHAHRLERHGQIEQARLQEGRDQSR